MEYGGEGYLFIFPLRGIVSISPETLNFFYYALLGDKYTQLPPKSFAPSGRCTLPALPFALRFLTGNNQATAGRRKAGLS